MREDKNKRAEQKQNHTNLSISTTTDSKHTRRHVGGGGGDRRRVSKARERKGRGGVEGFGIALSQKGKCSSSSRVREGYRVKRRGTLQQLVSIIHGVTAECTGACVCMCVHVCKAEASQGEG